MKDTRIGHRRQRGDGEVTVQFDRPIVVIILDAGGFSTLEVSHDKSSAFLRSA